MKIHIGEDAKAKLMETLAADVEFLTKLHVMDYSLLLGVHNCDADDQDVYTADAQLEEEEDDQEGDYDSGGSAGVAMTPPDSPRQYHHHAHYHHASSCSSNGNGRIDPEKDIYAIPSRTTSPNREIYFLALVDILTHYGVKKQAAKVAKTVKYGSSVDGISTVDPDQYAARFLDFMSKAIE